MNLAYYRAELGSHERWGLADITEVDTCQLPLSLLANKHQRGTQLRVEGVALIGRLLGKTANHDGSLGIGTPLELVQSVSGVL